ncbi:MAG: energy transducer TonB [Spirochaetales bacterium]|nr:energy transducer TonB [Spirochaetales bacterium]
MSSFLFMAKLSEDRQRLLKGIIISLAFHLILILGLGGVSLIYSVSAPLRAGPLTISIEPFNIPYEDDSPVEPPEPEVLPAAVQEDLPVEEVMPEPLPEEEIPVADEAELPEASPGDRPSLENSSAPVEAVEAETKPVSTSPSAASSAVNESGSEDGPGYVGSNTISAAYAALLNASRDAELNDGGRSGQTLTAPEEAPEWTGSSSSGIYSAENRRVVDKPLGNSSIISEKADNGDSGLSDKTLADLDSAIDRISDSEEGIFIFSGSDTGVTASIPGNEGDNTSQISFLDGEGRRLTYSEPPVIPSTLRSIGLPEYMVKVYFTVTPQGTVKDLKIEPSSGNNELDASIKQSVRNWLFTSSGESGDVKAMVQFLIKVKRD